MGHGFLALLPRRRCDHPRFTHGCSLAEAEQLRTTWALSSSLQAALRSQPALGLVSSSRPAVGLECSSLIPWRPRSTGGAALNPPFLAKHHCGLHRSKNTRLLLGGKCFAGAAFRRVLSCVCPAEGAQRAPSPVTAAPGAVPGVGRGKAAVVAIRGSHQSSVRVDVRQGCDEEMGA